MRIFSIHKSKSKKQISEKTPKLAAQKFLEKRKVGTVIYLYEHPSGKIHGPYRKEYDKKIMKGGLSIDDFMVDGPPGLLYGTTQLIIKRTRVGFLSNEPRLFFGKKDITDAQGNNYYTFVCKNKDYDINNLILFRKLQIINNTAQIIDLNLQQVKDIKPEILLGFYTQYIDRCREDFPEGREIIFRFLYMRRLFFYLFYHILPIITLYIVNKYFENISQNNSRSLRSNPEIGYLMNIVSFIRRIHPVDTIIDEICFTCNIPITDQRIIKIKEEVKQSMNGLTRLNILTQEERTQELRRSIGGLQEIASNSRSADLVNGIAITGALPNPVEVVQVTGGILCVIIKICGIFGFIMNALR